MPELPEVETVRRGLAALEGSLITEVQVFRDSAVRHHPHPHDFIARLEGARLGPAHRRGKYLWWTLLEPGAPAGAAPVAALSAHLGMSGQFRVFDTPVDPHAHCRSRWTLEGSGGRLTVDFLDQRTFGYLRVEPLVPTPDGGPGGVGSSLAAMPASVSHIARDAMDPAARAEGLRKGRRAIKQVLLDQTVVSGIGNIYADEALWLSSIHPAIRADALTGPRAAALLEATREVMSRALAEGGTSFDALYVNVNGESGYFSRALQAYAQHGRPCARCGSLIERGVLGGRSTHWCPSCQRGRGTGPGTRTRGRGAQDVPGPHETPR